MDENWKALVARLFTRALRAGFAAQEEELQMRVRNAVIYGTSHPEAMAPRERTKIDELFAPEWKDHA